MDVIGIDPHKGSHTATMLDQGQRELRRLTVRAGRRQVAELLEWADGVMPRTWAVESAGGMGYLLSQQLVAAGETVLDVPASLASRVRVLGTGQSTKTDPNDARSVAIAALHAPSLAVVRRADHVTVCRLLAKRHTDLARWRTKQCCRLHALISELVAGGIDKEVVVNQARSLLEGIVCDGCGSGRTAPPGGRARRRHRTPRRRAQGLEGTDHCGGHRVGDDTHGDLRRRPDRRRHVDRLHRRPVAVHHAPRYAAYSGTAPIEFSSGGRVTHRLSRRGNRRLNHALHCAAITQIRHRHSPGRGYYERKLAEGHTAREAIRSLKRRLSDVAWRHLVADARRSAAE